MNYNFNETGKRIRELRKKSKMSQDDLANAIYFSRKTISYWECGKQEPTVSAIFALCSSLKCSADYLLGLSVSEADTV